MGKLVKLTEKELERLIKKRFTHVVSAHTHWDGYNYSGKSNRPQCKCLEDVVKAIKEGNFYNINGFFCCFGEIWWLSKVSNETPLIIFNDKLTEIVASKKYFDGKKFPPYERACHVMYDRGESGIRFEQSIEVAYNKKNPKRYGWNMGLGALARVHRAIKENEEILTKRGIKMDPWLFGRDIGILSEEDLNLDKYVRLKKEECPNNEWTCATYEEYEQGFVVFTTCNDPTNPNPLVLFPIRKILPDIVEAVVGKEGEEYIAHFFKEQNQDIQKYSSKIHRNK